MMLNMKKSFIFFGRVFILLSFLFSLSVYSEGNETYPVINTNRILSSEYLSSTYHRVESISIENGFYQFDIDSDIGHFTVFSLALLKKRVNEIKTLGQVINQFEQQNDQFSGELRSELSVSGESAVDILTSPFSTASKLAGQLTNNLGDTLAGEDPYVDDASPRYSYKEPGDPTTAAHKRNIAFQLGLDLYSNNNKVQSFLNVVANARSSGKVSAGVGLANAFSQSSNLSELDRQISFTIKSKSLSELMTYNRQLLDNLKIKTSLADAFIDHAYLSPTNKTTILVYLNEMKKVSKPASFIELTLTANNEVMALAFERVSKMLLHYYNNVEGFSAYFNFKGQPAVITDSRRIVLFEYADFLIWSPRTEKQYVQSAEHAERSGYDGWELVSLGTVSPLANQKISELGYKLRFNFLSEYLN